MKTIQFFSREYLEECKALQADHIIQFLDDFRKFHTVFLNDHLKEEGRLSGAKVSQLNESRLVLGRDLKRGKR